MKDIDETRAALYRLRAFCGNYVLAGKNWNRSELYALRSMLAEATAALTKDDGSPWVPPERKGLK